jgi:hypothetical protein
VSALGRIRTYNTFLGFEANYETKMIYHDPRRQYFLSLVHGLYASDGGLRQH